MNTTQIIKKIKMLGDPSSFSWAQAFSDKTGKTSITSIGGGYITFLGGLIFAIASIGALFSIVNSMSIIADSLWVIGTGSALLGVNKIVAGKAVPEDVIADPTVPDSKDASDVASSPNGPNSNN